MRNETYDRISGCRGNGGEIQRTAANRHSSDCFMRSVIDYNMNQIGRKPSAYNRQSAEVHQTGTVPIQAPNPSLRFFNSDAECNHARMSHRTYGQEITGMVFVPEFAQFKYLT